MNLNQGKLAQGLTDEILALIHQYDESLYLATVLGVLDIIILYKGKPYKAHRLAWLFVYKNFPEKMIDHIDGDTSNNKILNLRDVDSKTNQLNRHKARVDSVSGLMGVSPFRNKWRAQIKRNGTIKYLGLYIAKEDAYNAYLKEKNGAL